MDNLPLVAMFKVFKYLTYEDRVSVSQVCTIWRYLYQQFNTRRRRDCLTYRQHRVNGGQLFCRYMTVKQQMTRLRRQISYRTLVIKQLTVDLDLSQAAVRKHHITIYSPLMEVG